MLPADVFSISLNFSADLSSWPDCNGCARGIGLRRGAFRRANATYPTNSKREERAPNFLPIAVTEKRVAERNRGRGGESPICDPCFRRIGGRSQARNKDWIGRVACERRTLRGSGDCVLRVATRCHSGENPGASRLRSLGLRCQAGSLGSLPPSASAFNSGSRTGESPGASSSPSSSSASAARSALL